jgi:hypothetical protein
MLASKQPGTRSGNDRIEHKDSDSTPKDKARTGGSSTSTPTTPRNMVYAKLKLGNTCANVYTQGNLTRVVPMTAVNAQPD